MWHLGLEAGSALTIGLGVLPVIAGLASLWLPERRADPRWRAFAAFLGASIVTFVPVHRGEGCLPLDRLRHLRRGAQPDLPRAALDRRHGRLLLGTATVVARVLVAPARFAGWLILHYGYQLAYPYFEAPGYGITQFANRVFYWNQPAIRLGLAAAFAVSVAVALLPFARRLDRLRPPCSRSQRSQR